VTLLQILVVLAVVAAVAAVAAGVLRGSSSDLVGLPEPTTTVPALQLPSDRFTGADLDRLRFSTGLRGYRMDVVDEVLDRLSAELRARDAEVGELRARLYVDRPATVHSTEDAVQEGAENTREDSAEDAVAQDAVSGDVGEP
jgi:DivIVA domain-containing protein